MKNKFILILSLVFFASICFTGCEVTDENTGDSTLVVNAPAVTINYAHGSVTTLVETNAKYPFTVSIANPIEYDVVLKLDVINATATQGEDFEVPNEIFIPAGSTSASSFIEIFEDDIIEDQESFTVSIGGRTINGNSNPVEATFVIANLTSGDLAIYLDWAASSKVTDNSGNEINPYALADLRLLLTDVPYTTILDNADGGSAELYTLSGDAPDGEYYIVADFYDAMDLPADLDLMLTFSQIGVNEGVSYTFPAALNTSDLCPNLHYTLAKVTKIGESYSFTQVGEKSTPDLANYVGTWTGKDIYGPTEMTTTLNVDGQLEVTGIATGFMTTAWGEVIINQENLIMEIDFNTLEVTIAEQYYMTTTYEDPPGSGAEVQPDYYLSATGTIDLCTNTIDLVYDLVQDGTSYTAWLTPYGYAFHEINKLQ